MQVETKQAEKSVKPDTFAKRRDRVTAEIVEPLCKAGLRKQKNTSAADHAAFLVAVAEALAWVPSQWFSDLRDMIERSAAPSGGSDRKRDLWPSLIAIKNMARELCPAGEVPQIVMSWMRSKAGRAAWERSAVYAIALERYIRVNLKGQRPPGDGHEAQVQEIVDGIIQRINDARRLLDDPGLLEGVPAYEIEQRLDAERKRIEAFDAQHERVRWMIFGDLDQDPRLVA